MAEQDIQKLAVDIEGMKKDIANASMFHSRLDTAIDKLTDVSTSIKQMLAVHEQKLSQTEKTEEILFDKSEKEVKNWIWYIEIYKEILLRSKKDYY